MRKAIVRLSLNRNTIRNLVGRELELANGGANAIKQNTLNGTGPNCASDAGGCESGNWSCARVSCC